MGFMVLDAESLVASAHAVRESSLVWHALGYLLVLVFAAGLVQWTVAGRQGSSSGNLPPGPIAVPLFGHWLQVGSKITARRMAVLAKKYGDIMLLKMGRRNLLLIHSPELAKDVLHTQGVTFGSRSSNVVVDIFTGSGKDLSFANYGEHWRKARRIVTLPFFTNVAVKHWTPLWGAETDRLVDSLANNPEAFQGGVMIRKSLQLLAHNNLFMAAFGFRFESENDALYVELRKLNEQRSILMQSFDYNYGDYHRIFHPLVRQYLKKCWQVKEGRERLFKYFISERIELTSAVGPSQYNLKTVCGIDHILASVTAGEISDENVIYLIENLNGAGIDTILITLEWLIAELVNNPDIQDKLYAEVQTAVGSSQEQKEIDWTKLPYLEVILKEIFRLHPPAPLIVPHMNLKRAKVAGYDIPARCKVIVNGWWLANNPEWWTEPDKFNPERFLPGKEEEKVGVQGNSSKYLPFGLGRRQCPGMLMAMATVRLAIVKLVLAFELLPPPSLQKLDLTERGGQFLMRMATTPVILLRHRKAQ